MTMGGGIGLIAVGAILMFALNDTEVGPVNFYVIGLILVLAGIAGIVISILQSSTRRKAESVEVTHHEDGSVSERRSEHKGGTDI